MPGKYQRTVLHTVLLVGEGATEVAFLRYLKLLYIHRGCGVHVTIRNARGKGANHVLDYAIRQLRNAAYDRVVTLLDTDIPLTAAAAKRAKVRKVQVIGSSPCVEGLLLDILGVPVPATSPECKIRCEAAIQADLKSQKSYTAFFPKAVLNERKDAIVALGLLLNCFVKPDR